MNPETGEVQANIATLDMITAFHMELDQNGTTMTTICNGIETINEIGFSIGIIININNLHKKQIIK